MRWRGGALVALSGMVVLPAVSDGAQPHVTVACPPGEACPAIEPLPHQVGKFTFRVTPG